MVLAVSERLEGQGASHPEVGEDVKVMGVRSASGTQLTVACAFVDLHVRSADDYVEKKARVAELTRATARSLDAGTSRWWSMQRTTSSAGSST